MPRRKNTVVFDANMILRYLLNDNTEMAEKAEKYLNTCTVFVTTEVIAEVVYVSEVLREKLEPRKRRREGPHGPSRR